MSALPEGITTTTSSSSSRSSSLHSDAELALQVGDELVSVEGVPLLGCSAGRASALLEEAMGASAYVDGGVKVEVVGGRVGGDKGGSSSGSNTATACSSHIAPATHTLTLHPVSIALKDCVSWCHLPSGARYVRIQGNDDFDNRPCGC